MRMTQSRLQVLDIESIRASACSLAVPDTDYYSTLFSSSVCLCTKTVPCRTTGKLLCWLLLTTRCNSWRDGVYPVYRML